MIENTLVSTSVEDELDALLKLIKEGPPPSEHGVCIDNSELQVVMLAIAKLALERPGWNWMLGEIADRFGGRELFEQFKDLYYHEALNE
jgi:hypothetical protein